MNPKSSALHVIPVVDLRDGQAVHAVAGRRDDYRPLNSPLCPNADPVAVIAAYRRLYPFETFYIADLDAIERSGDNRSVVAQLLRRYPDCRWWLDRGVATPDELAGWPAGALRAVIGSESQHDLAGYRALLAAAEAGGAAPILSLDFRNGRFLGPAALLEQPASWPRDVIWMQLDRVGAGQGPEAAAPSRPHGARLFAAGGVRDIDDLRRLRQAGYAGALVASALHDGRLGAAELTAFVREQASLPRGASDGKGSVGLQQAEDGTTSAKNA